jgi:hypothetical protein
VVEESVQGVSCELNSKHSETPTLNASNHHHSTTFRYDGTGARRSKLLCYEGLFARPGELCAEVFRSHSSIPLALFTLNGGSVYTLSREEALPAGRVAHVATQRASRSCDTGLYVASALKRLIVDHEV